jgi:hypothetical protein
MEKIKKRKWTDRNINEKTLSYRKQRNIRAQRNENKLYPHMKKMHIGIGWEKEEENSKDGIRGTKITNSMVEYSLKFLTFKS